MGLAPRVTEAAISTLPGAVTLGFAPYRADLGRLTARAREKGQGPHTLLANASKAANIDNLTWLMSRFTGYPGVANFLGGKFTADERALTPVLREISARGLSSQSLALALARRQGLAAARADLVLDSTARPEAIEAAFARLEEIARDKGVAIGVASALPDSIASVGRLSRALEERGIALIPLSAAMTSPQSGLADSSIAR
jgi:polysaccharide deacetylase 2 family uncharacterized protein YibQ